MAGIVRIGLISDTHNLVRPEALDALRGVEHIVHAGDICATEVLDTLAKIAPLTAVRGNNDARGGVGALRESERIVLWGKTVFVVHDIADVPRNPHAEGIDLVVTGHSHKPLIETRDGVLFVNPGSAGPRRFKLPITIALLEIEDGTMRARIVPLVE
jgi:putative phosphoesterase